MYLDQLETLCNQVELVGLEATIEVEESLFRAQGVEQIQKHNAGLHVVPAFGGEGHFDQVLDSLLDSRIGLHVDFGLGVHVDVDVGLFENLLVMVLQQHYFLTVL